jgi:hypothetical protein
MTAEKQEKAIQRQLLQIAKREEKEAEKAQKTLEKKEKRRQKEQEKQAKAALSLGRKKAQEIHRQLAVATQLATLSDAQTQRLSVGPSTMCKTRRISTKKVVKPPKGSQRRVRRSFGPSPSSLSNAANAVAMEAEKRSQHDRMVALPQRFRE